MNNNIPEAGKNGPRMELMRFSQQPGNEINLLFAKSQKIRQGAALIQRGCHPLLQVGWHLLSISPGKRESCFSIKKASKVLLKKPFLLRTIPKHGSCCPLPATEGHHISPERTAHDIQLIRLLLATDTSLIPLHSLIKKGMATGHAKPENTSFFKGVRLKTLPRQHRATLGIPLCQLRIFRCSLESVNNLRPAKFLHG